MNKSILDMVQDTAQQLYDAGVMKETTLREFDAMCLPPVKVFTAEQIKSIRTKNRASQGVFAAYLNTREGLNKSTKTQSFREIVK